MSLTDAQLGVDAPSAISSILQAKEVKDLPPVNVKYSRDEKGQTVADLEVVDPNGGLKGTIRLTDEQAKRLSIETGNIYDPEDIDNLQALINYRGGSTTTVDPHSKEAYYRVPTLYNMQNFPYLSSLTQKQLGADVKGNIIQSNGLNYGIYYVKSPNKEVKMYVTKGTTNLKDLVNYMKSTATPEFIQSIISNGGR